MKPVNPIRSLISKTTLALIATAGALILQGCSESSDYNFDKSIQDARNERQENTTTTAILDPVGGDIPFPNNLLFRNTTDFTLNIPLPEGVDETDFGHPVVAMNTLDGFSLTEPMVSDYSGPVDASTAVIGESVRVFEVTVTNEGVVNGIVRELTQFELTVATRNNSLVIVPLVPLSELTNYVVVLTNGVLSEDGEATAPSAIQRLLAGEEALTGEIALLEPLRILTDQMLKQVANEGVARQDVTQIWNYRTQSISASLQAVKNNTTASAITIAPTGQTTSLVSEQSPGFADIHIGTLDLPYYRTAPANPGDVTGASSFWQGAEGSNLTFANPMPVATGTQTVPVLMTVPNARSGHAEPPAGGWPITIFIHGITTNRLTMLGLADAMAQAGIAMIAIDLPMHGITDAAGGLAALVADNTPFPNDTERTFNLDLVNNTTRKAEQDGLIDDSGTHFYSPGNLLATRDNLRQAVADIMVLSASLASINTVPLNTSLKTVVGHSLGGTVATMVLAYDDTFSAATLAMPAAGLTRLMMASPSFGPILSEALAASGLEAGSEELESFLVSAQTVVDSGDAINHALTASANAAFHILEVVGDGADNLPDQVVPNNVATAPLSGTDPLVRMLGYEPQNPATVSTSGGGVVQFTEGDHGSIVRPDASPAAFAEMQRQTVTFAVSLGTQLLITDNSVIRQPSN